MMFHSQPNGQHNAYTATVDGCSILIEHASQAIEDGRGWVVWIGNRTPSIEYPTLVAAKAAAAAEISQRGAS